MRPRRSSSPADVSATEPTSDVGNMAWVGQALVHLYERTGTAAFLAGARELARWIQTEAYDERGAGGYTGGEERRRQSHRLEVHRAQHRPVRVLQPAGRGRPEKSAGARPRRTPGTSWKRCGNPSEGRRMFWVGTGEDGVTPNRGLQVEDVNSWSYLALRDPAFASSLNWVVEEPGGQQEGLQRRELLPGLAQGGLVRGHRPHRRRPAGAGRPGRRGSRRALPGGHRTRPAGGPNSDGKGIIAASRDGVGDCEGETYYASLHTGATAWYLLAAQGVDPFDALEGGL